MYKTAWNISLIILFLILSTLSISALECFSQYPGYQRFVANSQGLVYPPEAGRSDVVSNAIPLGSPLLKPIYYTPSNKRKQFERFTERGGVLQQSSRTVRRAQNVLKYGAMDNEVKELQRCLAVFGFPISLQSSGTLGRETTYFGKATEHALRRFQRYVRIEETGTLDQKTRFFLQYPNAIDASLRESMVRAEIEKISKIFFLLQQIKQIHEKIRRIQLQEAGRL